MGLSPWTPTERDGRWYGRDVADNKGQHVINLAAVLATRGQHGFNGKWLIGPSMTMTHLGPYLGVPPTGRKLSLRVMMDFWRCRAGAIMENWVLLDLVDLFAQMDIDLIRRSKEREQGPNDQGL